MKSYRGNRERDRERMTKQTAANRERKRRQIELGFRVYCFLIEFEEGQRASLGDEAFTNKALKFLSNTRTGSKTTKLGFRV